jgi:serine/threonine protein kinase
VTIFDVGEWGGRPYLVMEYLPGGSLADRLLRDGRPSTGVALRWLEHAARGLDAAHAAGIVHRDVKPANMLLDERDDVRMADFGIARAVGVDSLTTAGTVLGTAGYIAPEQARGEQSTPASDRYALGVVAFELLSGVRPFERDTPTAEALAHVNAPVPSVRDFRQDLTAASSSSRLWAKRSRTNRGRPRGCRSSRLPAARTVRPRPRRASAAAACWSGLLWQPRPSAASRRGCCSRRARSTSAR